MSYDIIVDSDWYLQMDVIDHLSHALMLREVLRQTEVDEL